MKAFQIEGPAVISFSGGRTSGYMLRRVENGIQNRELAWITARPERYRPQLSPNGSDQGGAGERHTDRRPVR